MQPEPQRIRLVNVGRDPGMRGLYGTLTEHRNGWCSVKLDDGSVVISKLEEWKQAKR